MNQEQYYLNQDLTSECIQLPNQFQGECLLKENYLSELSDNPQRALQNLGIDSLLTEHSTQITNIIEQLSYIQDFEVQDGHSVNMNELLTKGIYRNCSLGRPQKSANGEYYTCIVIPINQNFKVCSGITIGQSGTPQGTFKDVNIENIQFKEFYSSNDTLDENTYLASINTQQAGATVLLSVAPSRANKPANGILGADDYPALGIGYGDTPGPIMRFAPKYKIEGENRWNYERGSIGLSDLRTFELQLPNSGFYGINIASDSSRYYNWWVFDVRPACGYTPVLQICFSQTRGRAFYRMLYTKDNTKFVFPFTLYSDWKGSSTEINSIYSDIEGLQNDIDDINNQLNNFDFKGLDIVYTFDPIEFITPSSETMDKIYLRIMEYGYNPDGSPITIEKSNGYVTRKEIVEIDNHEIINYKWVQISEYLSIDEIQELIDNSENNYILKNDPNNNQGTIDINCNSFKIKSNLDPITLQTNTSSIELKSGNDINLSVANSVKVNNKNILTENTIKINDEYLVNTSDISIPTELDNNYQPWDNEESIDLISGNTFQEAISKLDKKIIQLEENPIPTDYLTENDVNVETFDVQVPIATIGNKQIYAPAIVEAADINVPVASQDTLGGIKIGYSSTSNNRAVQLSNQKAYVQVPDATIISKGLMVAEDKILLSDLDDSRLLEKYAYETWLTSTPGTFVCTDVVDSGNPYATSTQSNDYFDCNIMNITYTTEYGVQKNILDAILDESHKKPFRIYRFIFGHTDNTADISYIAVRLYHQEYNTGTKDGVNNALLNVTSETYLIEGNVRISGSGNNVVIAVNPSFENNTINRYSMTVTYFHGEVYTITYNDLTSEKIIDDITVLKSKDFVSRDDYDILVNQLANLTQNSTNEVVVNTETNSVKVKVIAFDDIEDDQPETEYPRMIGVNQNQFVVNQIYPETNSQFNRIDVNYSGEAKFLIPTTQALTGHIDYDSTKLEYCDGVGYIVTPVNGAYLTIGDTLDQVTNKMPQGSYRYMFSDITNRSKQTTYRTCYIEDDNGYPTISSTKVIRIPKTAGSININIDNLPKYWESYPSDWSIKRYGFVINDIHKDTWFDFKTYTQAQISNESNGMLTDVYTYNESSTVTKIYCAYTANTSNKYRYTYITTDDFIGIILIQDPNN